MAFNRPETPLVAVDILIELVMHPGEILLIERKFPPFGWALPGGFVDVGESVEVAAIREAKEETSLQVNLTQLLGCYSDPSRDKRGHTVSLVFIATSEGIPEAADDAKALKLWPIDQLPPLVFDHDQILSDYMRYQQSGNVPLYQPHT